MSVRELGTTGGRTRVLHFESTGRRAPSPRALARALRLLLACGAPRLRVELDGCWTADGRPWLRCIERAAADALRAGLEFSVVYRAESLPSSSVCRRLRLIGARAAVCHELSDPLPRRARKRLESLRARGLDGFIEVSVRPDDRADLEARLRRLETLSPAKVRFVLSEGRPWGRADAGVLFQTMTRWLEGLLRTGGDRPPVLEVLNFWDDEDPAPLRASVGMTPAGRLGWSSVRGRGLLWPQAARAEAPPAVQSVSSLAAAFLAPTARHEWVRAALGAAERSLWDDNVAFALRFDAFFRRPFRGFRDRSENRVLRAGVLRAGLADQDRFLRLRLPGVAAVFYFIRSGCLNDCIFCKLKVPDRGQPLDEVKAFLADNRTVGRRRIALVGNEPLLHPRILEIVRQCRRSGFREIEVMTSGTLLSDEALVRGLKKAGATAFPIPLYSSVAEEHDALTGRAGSFHEAVRGIENLRRHGLQVRIHANLMRQNIHALGALDRLVRVEWGLPFAVLCLRPKDPDSMNLAYRALEPSYSELIDSGVGAARLVGFPMCVTRRLQDPSPADPELLADGIKLYLLHQNFVKPPGCEGCTLGDRCVGTFQEHLDLHPGDAQLLRP